MTWFDQVNEFLSSNRSFYFYLAVAGSVVFVIQFILMLVGLSDGTDAGLDADVDAPDIDMGGDGLSFVSFFSIKSIIAFITFFGWAGFFWGDMGLSGALIALLCGLAMMVLTTLITWFFIRMQQSGNLRTEDYVGKSGTVYLTIPAGRQPGGQITVRFDDRTRQTSAVADEELPTGTAIRVVEAVEPGLFLVARF